MKLKDYQKQAITTKIYDDSVAFSYVVLGICGEAAELYEKLIFELKQSSENAGTELLQKEIGDVAWYLAAWAEENSLQLVDIFKLADREVFPTNGLYKISQELVLYSGEIAEITKKALRDNFSEMRNRKFPEEKLVKVNLAAANLMSVLTSICFYLDFSFEQILTDNVEKLKSRTRRGTLGGSGDTR